VDRSDDVGSGFVETTAGRRPDRRDGATGKRLSNVSRSDGAPFTFAGLWERWKEPASGETVRSFTIITTTPNALCAPVHDCMPVILDPVDYPIWLGETPATGNELQALLRPFSTERRTRSGRGSAM
jgi:putative SOS response-associated peptidase YedK